MKVAPTGWQKAISEAKASGNWPDPWRELPELIIKATGFCPPPAVGSPPEFPAMASPVYEARRDVRRAHQKFIDSAGYFIRASEQRCGPEYSTVVDPLRSALHEIWQHAPHTDQDALIAHVRALAEQVEHIAGLRLPPGKDGSPETEVDIGTDLFVRAICCFRTQRGWTVHYASAGWRSAVAREEQQQRDEKAANDRLQALMPNETLAMIAHCLAVWGYKANPVVITKALGNYGHEVKVRGYGPRPEDLILFPALQSPPPESTK